MGRSPPSRLKAFVDRMLHYADDDTHGYSQKPPSGRWGPDYDCSSLIYQAAHDAGYPMSTAYNAGFNPFCNCGNGCM